MSREDRWLESDRDRDRDSARGAGVSCVGMADDDMKTVAIRAPAGAVPGGKVKINHQGHEVIVTYPSDVVPGQEIKVQVPKRAALPPLTGPKPSPPQKAAPNAAPPSGVAVRPGVVPQPARRATFILEAAARHCAEPY